jgi:glutamate dehydrogenase/leucine dehydrogenase
MELWIRSQNKGALIKVEMLGNTDGVIKSYLGQNQTILGEYKSNKRAVEVLDEIQKVISTYNTENGNYIYEMPQE